ncbi:MAG: sporulation protein YunB [Ignavibacteriales bacterium]
MYGPKRSLKRIVLLLVISACLLYFAAEYNMRDAAMAVAKSKTQLIGQEIIFRAVNEKVASNTDYQDIVSVHKDSDGRIVMLQPNAAKINRMMASTVLEVEKDFAHLDEQHAEVPMGQIMGNHLFSGFGPKINIKMVPAGQVKVDVMDHFKSAGINQTRHLISLKVSGKIRVVVPFEQEEVLVNATIPVAETIIVGQVPNSYMNFTAGGDIFRLKGNADNRN